MHPAGYGTFALTSTRNVRAHRYAYEQAYGPIPVGAVIRHSCDRPLCCEPTHLLIGSQLDNVHDRQQRQRQARGAVVSQAKLTEGDVIAIRAAVAAGTGRRTLAEQYGIDESNVRSIARRRTWAHVV